MIAQSEAKGFSLVETVIALGIFAFCIVVLLGLMLSGMRAARSVSDETNAVHVGNSILGAWQVQRAKGVPLTITNMVTNLPSLTQSVSREEVFFDEAGRQVESSQGASLKMYYSVSPDAASGVSVLELSFYWPPLATSNAAQSRSFKGLISL